MLPFVLINIKETVFNLSGKSQNIDTEFISQMFNVFHFYFDTCNLHVATKALTFSWLCFGTQSTKIRERLHPQSLKAHRTQYDECRMWTRVSVLCLVQTTQVNSILLQCNEENKTLQTQWDRVAWFWLIWILDSVILLSRTCHFYSISHNVLISIYYLIDLIHWENEWVWVWKRVTGVRKWNAALMGGK